jgi:hypothetical protein
LTETEPSLIPPPGRLTNGGRLRRTGSDNPSRLAAAARSLKGLDTDQIIEELVNEKRIDPRLIRALSRI